MEKADVKDRVLLRNTGQEVVFLSFPTHNQQKVKIIMVLQTLNSGGKK